MSLQPETSEHLALLTSALDKLGKIEERLDYAQKHNWSSRVSWEDKVTETGIQLAGSSSIARSGVILAGILVPYDQNSMGPAFIVKRDGDQLVTIIPTHLCKFLES